MKYFIGIDIGGTTTTVAIGNSSLNICLVSDQFATDSASGPSAALTSISRQVSLMLRELSVSPDDCYGVGLSTPGPSTLDGVLLGTPNLKHPEWRQFPIRAALEDRLRKAGFHCDVVYIGDGQSAALGEFQVRSGTWKWSGSQESALESNLRSLFMVIVGTGLGGGEVRDRGVVRGLAGRAGHGGHIFLPAAAFRYEQDADLLVGNAKSTVESAVSLTALTHQLAYRLSLPKWADHPLHEIEASIRDKAKALRGFADAGDSLALELFDDQAKALGIALLSINYIGDYDLLVIGGGVCDLSIPVRERYMQMVLESYYRHALDGFRGNARIEFSVCNDTAPVIGAVAYAWQNSL